MGEIKAKQLIRIYRYGIDFDLMMNQKPVYFFLIANYNGKQYEIRRPYIEEKDLKEIAEEIKRK